MCRVRIRVCVSCGGASRASLRSPRSAPALLIVEFICVFMLVFMFASAVGRLASLASLASLGARFHCEVHMAASHSLKCTI